MTRPLNRRAFLATTAVATAGLAVAGARPAGAATSVTVYRLNSDWGYPVGPKNKTRCACRSCVRRAENAYFETRAAAIAGRVHPCCVCQPYRARVDARTAGQLFAGGDSVDRRDPRIAAMFEHTPIPVPDPIATIVGLDPTGAAAASSAASGFPAAAPAPAPPSAAMGFARTGTNLRLAGIGAGLLTIGGALVALRTRRPATADATSPSQPQPKDPS